MAIEDRGTGDKELAAEIAVLEDLPQRGRTAQGLAWLRELQKRRSATTPDRENVRKVVRLAIGEATHMLGKFAPRLDAIADRAAEQLSAPTSDDNPRAAMLLLDGLTGHRSAHVFEAARHAETLIASIPGRRVELEPSKRGAAIHAEQLSGVSGGLSETDRAVLLRLRGDVVTPKDDHADDCATCRRSRETIATLDRLLGTAQQPASKPHHAGRQAIPVIRDDLKFKSPGGIWSEVPTINPADTPELREAISKIKAAGGRDELFTVTELPGIRDFASAPAVRDNPPILPGSFTTGSNGGLGGGGRVTVCGIFPAPAPSMSTVGGAGGENPEWIAHKKELDASIPGQPPFKQGKFITDAGDPDWHSGPAKRIGWQGPRHAPGWRSRVHAAADKIDRGANVDATPPDEKHPLGQVSVTPRRIAVELVLANFEQAAKAATAGRWDSPKEGPGSAFHAVTSDWGVPDEGYGGHLIGESLRPANGAYVVAAQPATILALIATVREMIPLVKDWALIERSEANRLGIVDSVLGEILNRALTVEVQ
jgi:hypothetical protein